MEKFLFDEIIDDYLIEVNNRLESFSDVLHLERRDDSYPILIICFPPRSGSTLLAQLLSRTRSINYITNFTARFWEAPTFAGLLQKKLGVYDLSFSEKINNQFGVTDGINEPHEFGYFWNKWLKFKGETHIVNESEVDCNNLKNQLESYMSIRDQPFFIKNSIVGLNANFFKKLFTNVKFIVLKRDIVAIVKSIYNTRAIIKNRVDEYWSLRPSNFQVIKNLPPLEQIVRQVLGIYDDIYCQLEGHSADYIEVKYEDILKDHNRIIDQISSLLNYNLGHVDIQLVPITRKKGQVGNDIENEIKNILKKLQQEHGKA